MTESAGEARKMGARASGILDIDLSAITENWRRLRSLVAPGACAAVVKADAYGTGLLEAGLCLGRCRL